MCDEDGVLCCSAWTCVGVCEAVVKVVPRGTLLPRRFCQLKECFKIGLSVRSKPRRLLASNRVFRVLHQIPLDVRPSIFTESVAGYAIYGVLLI